MEPWYVLNTLGAISGRQARNDERSINIEGKNPGLRTVAPRTSLVHVQFLGKAWARRLSSSQFKLADIPVCFSDLSGRPRQLSWH